MRVGRVTQDELVDRLERQGFRLKPLVGLPGFLQVEEEPHPISMTVEHWSGLLYVQQASTGVAAPVLGARPDDRVLDLCSAPGGKATHLAELMGERGCLVACEIDGRRMRGLLGNIHRLCHANILVVAGDGRNIPEGALFDRVLVDAPCSGEGTLRRRAGEAPEQSPSFLGYVARAQRALLARAITVTKPGGVVLYVTCTFAPEENEAVVSDVLERAPVELEVLDLPFPHAPGLTSFDGKRYDPRLEGAARIYPHHLDSGGLFMAKLRRLDGEASGTSSGGTAVREQGWSPVPVAFPDGERSEADAREEVSRALDAVAVRYGVSKEDLEEWGWMARGRKLWVHRAREWPLGAWDQGTWRPVSVGLRALELDDRSRPRPTNDFLRFASGKLRECTVDLAEDRLLRLLHGGIEPVEGDRFGPVALRLDGDVVGRGTASRVGLVSEIPKARAQDLGRVLDAGRSAATSVSELRGEERVGRGEL